MQEIDAIISMLSPVVRFMDVHYGKIPGSVLKFYVYLNNIKYGAFKEDRFDSLYKSSKISLLDFVRQGKFTFDSEQKEKEWFAIMDDLVRSVLHNPDMSYGTSVFNPKQRGSLDGEGAWLEKKVIEAFDKDEKFEISETIWQMYRDKYGFSTQQQFYENVLRDISESVSDKLKQLFESHNEGFFADLVEKLKRKGVLFLNKSYYLIPGIAFYNITRNFIKFRDEKINSEGYITLKHELIHAAFYNLPAETRNKLRALLETEVARIREFLSKLDQSHEDTIREKYKSSN